MRTVVAIALALAVLAGPACADLASGPILYCTQCDPGNSKTASGGARVLCYDCSTNEPPGQPVVTCERCDLRGGRAAGGAQCTVTWP